MMNTVQLIGRLTKDVELRFTQSGTAVGSFTLAVNRNFTNQQGEREADFINCVIWKKAAENLSNFTRKGSLLGVEGRLQVRTYENQQGQRVYVTEVIVHNFTLLESKKEMEQRTGGQQYQQQQAYQQPPVQQQPQNPNAFQGYEYPQGHSMDFNENDLPF
ncbi:single-stranded DNA-binding protein [Aerococcaceae bacterium NML160702]|nr:single-stranded DNA-binding protein [Aerococcaceae bacterium NML160702]